MPKVARLCEWATFDVFWGGISFINLINLIKLIN